MSETEHEGEAPETEAPEGDEATESPDTDEEAEEASEQPEAPDEAQEPNEGAAQGKSSRAPSIEAQRKAQDKIERELAKLREAHADRVAKIMGDLAPHLEGCPLCHDFADGWLYGPQLEASAAEKAPALRTMLGIPEKRDLLPDPDLLPCDRCNCEGSNSTPSHIAGNDERVCQSCKGLGYLFRTDVPAMANGVPAAQTQPVVTGPTTYTSEPALPPELEAYKQRGYLIIPPTVPVG